MASLTRTLASSYRSDVRLPQAFGRVGHAVAELRRGARREPEHESGANGRAGQESDSQLVVSWGVWLGYPCAVLL